MMNAMDLFCGASGSGAPTKRVLHDVFDVSVRMQMLNHNPIACASAYANHPDDPKPHCTGVEDLNPGELYRMGDLAFLWASPSCTHHSRARGGKPVRDQQRSHARYVLRWARQTKPPIIMIENVVEFLEWGPTLWKQVWVKDKESGEMVQEWLEYPDPARKGECFKRWIRDMRRAGYRHEYRIINCADHGDPTTRTRLFIEFVSGEFQFAWPEPTHSKLGPEDPTGPKLRWVPAREILDLSDIGNCVHTRARKLAANTIRRMDRGARVYTIKPIVDAILSGELKELTEVESDHFLTKMFGTSNANSVDQPVSAITGGGGKGGIKHLLTSPVLVPNFGEREGQEPRVHDVDKPMPAATSHGAGGVVSPVIITIDNASSAHKEGVRSDEDPLSTIITKARHSLSSAVIVQCSHGHGNEKDPHSRRVHSVDKPLPVQTQKNNLMLVRTFIDKFYGTGVAASIDEPLDTATTKARFGLVSTMVMGQHSDSAARDANTAPLSTLVTTGKPTMITAAVAAANVAPDPDEEILDIVDHYNQGKPWIRFEDQGRPVRFKIFGQVFAIVFFYRMLTVKELALGQGFAPDHKFVGTKTQIVQQIGNAVPGHIAAALVRAIATANRQRLERYIMAGSAAILSP